MTDNHATTMFYERKGSFRRVFDSYADQKDDPAIKDVEWNAIPMAVKRFRIKKRTEPEKKGCWLRRYFNEIFK